MCLDEGLSGATVVPVVPQVILLTPKVKNHCLSGSDPVQVILNLGFPILYSPHAGFVSSEREACVNWTVSRNATWKIQDLNRDPERGQVRSGSRTAEPQCKLHGCRRKFPQSN